MTEELFLARPPISTHCTARDEFLCRRAFDRSLQWDADLPSDLVERIWSDPHALLADRREAARQAPLHRGADRAPGRHLHLEASQLGHAPPHGEEVACRVACPEVVAGQRLSACGRHPDAADPRRPRTSTLGPFQHCSYLLTDYIVGTSLYRLMRFERPSADFVEHLAQQVADIWQQLDDLGVWHNDFKTENFLVDRDGKVWLIDFERMRRFRDVATAIACASGRSRTRATCCIRATGAAIRQPPKSFARRFSRRRPPGKRSPDRSPQKHPLASQRRRRIAPVNS